ncbi:MAG: S26 family signal peptidase [Sulfuriferula sp.]
MRLPKLSTLAIIAAATLTLPFAALFAVGRLEHWSLNVTTCMPVGFYQRGPVPATLKDGDRVYFCPPVHESLPLSFAGPASMLQSTPEGENPAMHEAITGLWLDFAPRGKWHCAGNLMPFAKEVVATAGQTVEITKQGVIANGKRLPNSRIVTNVDGIPVIHLPIGTRLTIPKGYFWDYAPGTFAFTSAYYGPVPVKNILGSLKPALVIPGSQYWYTDKTRTK